MFINDINIDSQRSISGRFDTQGAPNVMKYLGVCRGLLFYQMRAI